MNSLLECAGVGVVVRAGDWSEQIERGVEVEITHPFLSENHVKSFIRSISEINAQAANMRE